MLDNRPARSGAQRFRATCAAQREHAQLAMDLTIDDALVHAAGTPLPLDVAVDPRAGTLRWRGALRRRRRSRMGTAGARHRLRHAAQLQRRAGRAGRRGDQAAVQGAAQGAVLYIKPRNTRSAHGRPIVVPAGVTALEMGASLGVVIGRTACRVREAEAHGVRRGLHDRQRRQHSARRLLSARRSATNAATASVRSVRG